MAQVSWLSLRVICYIMLFHIHQMNCMYSVNDGVVLTAI